MLMIHEPPQALIKTHQGQFHTGSAAVFDCNKLHWKHLEKRRRILKLPLLECAPNGVVLVHAVRVVVEEKGTDDKIVIWLDYIMYRQNNNNLHIPCYTAQIVVSKLCECTSVRPHNA